MIDLISNDVQRMEEDTVMWLYLFIPSCFILVVIAVLLVYLIGWQSLMGVFFICVLVPYFAGSSYISAALRLRTAAVSDIRISLMNQVVSGIRAIKMHAWEDEYRKQIQHTRRSGKPNVVLNNDSDLECNCIQCRCKINFSHNSLSPIATLRV